MSQLVEEEELYFYLVPSTTAISMALVRLGHDSKQTPVYFVSKTLSEVETRYTDFERMALALRMTTKKLRSYFQAHTIIVLTGSPVKAILYKPVASERLLKWAIDLNEFDIDYQPRSAIKEQVLANLIMERSEVHPQGGRGRKVDP